MRCKLFYVVILLLFIGFDTNAQVLPDELEAETKPKNNNFGLAVGLKATTMGFGGEIVIQPVKPLHLRLGGTYFKYSIQLDAFQDDVKGSSSLKTGCYSALLNIQIARPLYITVGGIYNLFEANLFGMPANSITVGSVVVPPEDVGSLEINIRPGREINPYAGIGFGRAISKKRVVSFALEFGAAYMDSPRVDLITTGMLTPTSSAEQKQQLQENLAWVNFYPMINFQLSFRIL
jgi:hypothetical protein